MFGSYPFGRVPFGEKALPVVEERALPYSSSDFLPLALSEQSLYKGLTSVLDYLLYKYHHDEIQKIAGLYDVFHPSFDEDIIAEFLGGNDFIVQPLTAEQKTTLCLMLSSLYEIKGLRRGIEGILSVIGIPAVLYESWEVAREVETGASARPDVFESAIWKQKINQCNVAVVFDATGRMVLGNADSDMKKAIEGLLWVCAKIHSFVWVMNYRSGVLADQYTNPVTDTSSLMTYQNFCDKYVFSADQDWCFLFKPIIECISTPDEDKVLAIFTERPHIVDLFVNREYASPNYDGFVLVDWTLADAPYSLWDTSPWQYDDVDKKASLVYSLVTYEYPVITPPLFYVLSKDHTSGQTPISGTYIVSFKVKADRVIPLLCTMITESGYPGYVEDIVASDIVDASDVVSDVDSRAYDGGRYFAKIEKTISGEKQVVLWPISFKNELPTLCIQGILLTQESVDLEIYDFKVERFDFSLVNDTVDCTISVDQTADTVTVSSELYSSSVNEDQVFFTLISGDIIGGLSEDSLYYITKVGDNKITLSDTTPSGTAIEISAAVGTSKISLVGVDLSSYTRYSQFREYYLEKPTRTSFRGYAKDSIDFDNSSISVPFLIEDGQLLYFTGNLPYPFFYLGNSYYYVVNSVVDYDNSTIFQIATTPSGDPIDLSLVDTINCTTSVNSIADTITIDSELYDKLSNEDQISFVSISGDLVGGVSEGVSYYVTKVGDSKITISSTTPAGIALGITPSVGIARIIGYLYYFEFVCETYNLYQLGTEQRQKFGWAFSDDGSVVSSDRGNYSETGYVLFNESGNLELRVEYPTWNQRASYVFDKVNRVQDTLMFSYPIPIAGVVSVSYDVELTQGEIVVSFGTQEYSPETGSFQVAKASDVFNTPGTYSIELKGPGYIPVIEQSFMLQVSADQEIGRNKALLSSFEFDAGTNTLTILKADLTQMISSCEKVYIHEEGTPSVVGTGFYNVVGFTEDSDSVTFSLSTDEDVPVSVDISNETPLDDELTFLTIPANAVVKNISLLVDSEVFYRGGGDFTFEEIGNPGDPEYWKVNDESEFWMVASDQQPYCCAEPGAETIEIGNETTLSDLSHKVGEVFEEDLLDWNFEDEIEDDLLTEIIGHEEGNPATSLIPVRYNWAAGTQLRIRPSSSGEMPRKVGDVPLEESAIYYVIPYDSIIVGDDTVYRIKLAESYSEANPEPPTTPTWIPLQSSSLTDVFYVYGSQLPPEWREQVLT